MRQKLIHCLFPIPQDAVFFPIIQINTRSSEAACRSHKWRLVSNEENSPHLSCDPVCMAEWPPSNQACFNSAKHKIIHVQENNTELVSPGWKNLSCMATGPRRRYDRTLAKWSLRSQIYSAFERKIHKVRLLHVGITLMWEDRGFLTWWWEAKKLQGLKVRVKHGADKEEK